MHSRSAELVSSVLDDLGDGVWVLNAVDSTVVDLNDAAARIVGRPIEELQGADFAGLMVPPLTREEWRLVVDQIAPGTPHRLVVRMGSMERAVLTELLLSSRPGATGGAPVIVGIARSLNAEGWHRQRSRQVTPVDVAVDALGDGVALIDEHGRIERVNPRFAELVGHEQFDLLGRSIFDPPWLLLDAHGRAVPPEDCPPAIAIRSRIAAAGTTARLMPRGPGGDDDGERWLEVGATPLNDDGGEPAGSVMTISDVTEVQRLRLDLAHALRSDQLTGLDSRTAIVDHLASAVEAASATDGARVGVLHLDLDNFRGINDTFGAVIGDQVLSSIGERLSDLSDRSVRIGRLGVDELLVVVCGEGPSSAFDARLRRLAEELQRRVEQRLLLEEFELRVTASVGIARWPGDGSDPSSLLRAADRALAAARRDGRQHLRFYERSLDEHTRTGLALDRDLRRAAAQRELEVHYQPIIDLRSGKVAAAEALVRWHHPEKGPIAPSVFIPTAEATGAISAISELVLTTVASDLADWNLSGAFPADARIAVNVSATEFTQRAFVERLADVLDTAGVRPDRLELEITETLLMQDVETTVARLEALDELGVLVALDDFGTGYSSLSYLHSLPLHTLKVDRCFVGDLRDGRSETITRAILSLAHGLGIVAVGEGVETEEQRRFLIDAGCDLVQGFYYAPPMPRAAFETFLAGQTAQAV